MAPLELAVGILAILVPIALLVLSFGPWMEHRTFVRLAAAEAARLVVTTNGDEEAAVHRIAGMAEAGGIAPESVRMAFCDGDPAPVTATITSSCLVAGSIVRGGTVTVQVWADVPTVVTPYGPIGIRTASYRHTEAVDLYRSMP